VFALNVPIAAGVVALTCWAVAESRGPATRALGTLRKLLGTRPVSLGVTMVAVSSFGVFGLLFVLTLYLQNVHGLRPITAGAWMLPPTCVVVIAAPAGGVLAQRFGPRWPVFGGLLLVGIGLAGLSLLGPDAGFTDLLYPGALAGAGTGLCAIAATDAIMGGAPDEAGGTASGLHQVASQLGGVLGVLVTGLVLSARSSVTQQVSALGGVSFLAGMRAALLAAAGVSVAGAALALFLPAAVRSPATARAPSDAKAPQATR